MAPKTPAPSDLADKFMLRLPDGMRDRIRAAAEANNRSMNAEIVARLEASLAPMGSILGAPNDPIRAVAEALTEMERRVAALEGKGEPDAPDS